MHSSTQQFVRAMDAKDIKHSDPETAAGGRETVTVIYSGENIPSQFITPFEILIYQNPDGNRQRLGSYISCHI